MGIVEHDIVGGKGRCCGNMKSHVTQLHAVFVKKTFLQEMSGTKAVSLRLLLLLPLALLIVVFELSSKHDNQLSILLSSSPLTSFGEFSSPSALIRFPNERLPRRAQPGRVLSSAFLREGNVNTSTLDLGHGEVRPFQPHGLGTHLYLQLGTYRSSPRVFATAGSVGRSVVDLLHPEFGCKWEDNNGTAVKAKDVTLHRPGAMFRSVYDSLIIICQFDHDVGVDGHGGRLVITYRTSPELHNADPRKHLNPYRAPESFVALTEAPGDYNASAFQPPFKFDVVYCGSPIFGNVSAQRIREWLAYHAYVMGDRSHFILYDAGGFSKEVQEVVRPWAELGRVSVQNIQQMQLYEGYYHHQHTVVNDCLFKSQFMANWTFFFDIDEYLIVDPIHSLTNFLAEKAAQGVSIFRYDQKRMSASLCKLQEPSVDNATRDALNSKLWGFEKFIFNMHWRKEPEANKYAVQGRYIWATEIHNTVSVKSGAQQRLRYQDRIWFHHFHGFINEHGEGCRDFADADRATWKEPFRFGDRDYSADSTLANLAADVKKFELATIGERPFIL